MALVVAIASRQNVTMAHPTRIRCWLIGYNTAVMVVLFVVFGVSLLGEPIHVLA